MFLRGTVCLVAVATTIGWAMVTPELLCAETFGVRLSSLYLNTSGGSGRILDDNFSTDYYDNVDGVGKVIRIPSAFIPPMPEGWCPFYWFHLGTADLTSLPGSGLRATIPENQELCMVTPGAANGPLDDNGQVDFRVYFTDPCNVWHIGSSGSTHGYLDVTRLPYVEATADNVGVNFGYGSGWDEGTYYDPGIEVHLGCTRSGIDDDGPSVILKLAGPSDVVGLRTTITPAGHVEGFYNVNGASWQSLGTRDLDWWPEDYLSVAYNVGVENETPEPATLSLLALGSLALLRHRRAKQA